VWLLLKLSAGYHDRAPLLLLTRSRKVIAGALVYALLGVMLYHNGPSAWGRVAKGKKDSRYVQICEGVREHAGAQSVVLATESVSWIIPACGPKVVVLRHQNPLVPGRATRERRVQSVFKGSATKSEIRELVSDYHVTHVLVRGRAKGGGPSRLGIRGRRGQRRETALPGAVRLVLFAVPCRTTSGVSIAAWGRRGESGGCRQSVPH
jgi:hypothetical protein